MSCLSVAARPDPRIPTMPAEHVGFSPTRWTLLVAGGGSGAFHLVVVHVLLPPRVGSESAGDDAVLLLVVRSGHVLGNNVSDLGQQLSHLQAQLGFLGIQSHTQCTLVRLLVFAVSDSLQIGVPSGKGGFLQSAGLTNK